MKLMVFLHWWLADILAGALTSTALRLTTSAHKARSRSDAIGSAFRETIPCLAHTPSRSPRKGTTRKAAQASTSTGTTPSATGPHPAVVSSSHGQPVSELPGVHRP